MRRPPKRSSSSISQSKLAILTVATPTNSPYLAHGRLRLAGAEADEVSVDGHPVPGAAGGQHDGAPGARRGLDRRPGGPRACNDSVSSRDTPIDTPVDRAETTG